MKICKPTIDDRGLESGASDHFGHAPFFILAEVDGGGMEVGRDPNCHEHHSSCQHVPLLKAHAVDAGVCEGIGQRAVSGLRGAGIDVIVSSDRTVSEIVDAVKAERARPLSADDACSGGRYHHRHGAGDGQGCRDGNR